MTSCEFVRDYAEFWTNSCSITAPNKGPNYSHADVCAASAVLNKGLPTLLDALGMIPGEGTLLKGLQWGASILSGTMIDNPGDAALSGGGLGLMALEAVINFVLLFAV